MLQGTIRRSVTIPSSLDNKISLMADEYNYKVKNDMIIEFLENGILKLNRLLEIVPNNVCGSKKGINN